MRENGKTWYRICKMLCEYKKYFPGIICCLLGSSFITFIHPLLIRQITDCGILQKNMKYILLFSVILIIISLTQQELNIIQTKLFSNVHNQFTHSLYKKTYWKINRMKIQYFAERGSAEIINTIGMDIDNVSSVVDQITQFSIINSPNNRRSSWAVLIRLEISNIDRSNYSTEIYNSVLLCKQETGSV